MNDLEVLEELIKDFENGIKFLHEQVIQSYTEMANIRNKKFQVEKLIKNLSKKKRK